VVASSAKIVLQELTKWGVILVSSSGIGLHMDVFLSSPVTFYFYIIVFVVS
jgi:hypothetical protein